MKIRADQIKTFERAAWERFECEMLEHSKEFSPHLSRVLGDDQLLVALRSAIGRAWSYGFTNRGPIRLFIELMFLCGSHFDTDPQYPLMGEALRKPTDQMVRAEEIHAGHNVYLEEVSGPEAGNVRNALRELAVLLRKPLPFSAESLEAGLHAEIKRIFPEKYGYAGEMGIAKLIDEGRMVSSAYGFSEARSITLIVVLMFAFGHGCVNDPLYPWIFNTLQDKRIRNPSGRALRLERKATTWLTYVLDGDGSGVRS